MPFTPRDWTLQFAWYVAVAATALGTPVAALVIGSLWLWELAGALTLLFALWYALLARAYVRSIQATTYVLEQVFEL
jgi:hypothetical protein